eukprot:scaffold98525_cov36-Phaeocystis_antarctica.AAC.1
MQDGKELEVKGLNKNPIQLTVPVADASDTKSKCTGQPDARNQMTALFNYEPACAETLECRYWDEENTIWSTEGCETKLYNGTDGGSFTGCECSHPNPCLTLTLTLALTLTLTLTLTLSGECSHLSEFVSITVPTD